MITTTSYKSNQFFLLAFKLFVVIGCLYFIYTKIASNQSIHFSEFQSFLTNFGVFSIKNLIFLLFLSAFNWFFEITKWMNLTSIIRKNSFLQSTKESLASLAFSIPTPNRIGEYGAKAMYYKKENLKKIVLLNFIGNTSQLAVTIFFGFFGVLQLWESLESKFISKKLFIFLVALLCIGFVLFWIPYIKKSVQKSIKFLQSVKTKVYLKIIILSFVRYLLFSHQFYYLLLLCNVQLTYFTAMSLVASLYLFSSFVPMF